MREIDFFKQLNKKAMNSILDSIIINGVTDDNIIISINNYYVKLYKLVDANFVLKDMNKKRDMLDKYKRVLNSLDSNVTLSIILRNKRVDLSKKVMLNESGDFIDIKKAINDTIKKNVDKNNDTYVVEKYLYFSFEAVNVEVAREQFKNIEHTFMSELETIDSAKLYEVKRDNIYKFLSMFYNKTEHSENIVYDDLITEDNRKALGISFKELIKPKNMEVFDKEIAVSDTYFRCFYFYNNYKIVDTLALNSILNNQFDTITCIKIQRLALPEAVREAELELGNADGEIYRVESELAKQGLSRDLLPRNAIQRKEDAAYINDSLKRRDENLFNVSMFVMIDANNIKTLNERTYKIQTNHAINGLNIKQAVHMQEKIFNSIMPTGLNQTPYIRTFDTESLCALNPFYASDLVMGNGDYYGVNILTHNPIMYDIMSGDNYNSLILGTSGKGKGFKAKDILTYRKLSGKVRSIIIIDPENEYGKLTKKLGGELIEITSGGTSHINLFDIDLSYGDNSISDKEDFVLSVIAEMLHKPITSGQRTTIANAVSEIYEKWQETNNKDDIPTIESFTYALKKIVDNNRSSEDNEILKAVMYYSDKSHCTLFRGKSNIDFSNNLITFNLSKLGKDLKTLAMEVLCDTIWLKICKNRVLGIPTDLIIDEFHLMFRSEETAAWMAKYWKMLRKYKGCPMGITQNPEDLLSSEDGRKVVSNTNMNILLSMLEKDREIIKDALYLTNEEIKYIREKKAGEGLLVIGTGKKLNHQTAIPFTNTYDKNNLLYALINTSGDEEIKSDNSILNE